MFLLTLIIAAFPIIGVFAILVYLLILGAIYFAAFAYAVAVFLFTLIRGLVCWVGRLAKKAANSFGIWVRSIIHLAAAI